MTDGDTSKFFYDEKGNLLREERTKNGVNYKVNYIYAGGEAIGFTLRGQWKIDLDGAKAQDFPFYYVKDAQGNVRKIVDRMGNCVVKYNYNAWGKETVTPVESTWEFPLELNPDGTVKKFCQASDIAELNRLTYRGYFYNREIGLYYLINRYYDPETGRFISADDAEYLDFQTLYGSNRYIYCLNNPVNNIDPEGTIAAVDDLLYITVAAMIIFVLVFATVAFESETHTFGNALADTVEWIEDKLFEQFASSSNVVDDNTVFVSQNDIKQKYKPKKRGARVKAKSRKVAEEMARKAGHGKKPLHHGGRYKEELQKWIPHHFHPNLPDNNPHKHDHFFYILYLFLFGDILDGYFDER